MKNILNFKWLVELAKSNPQVFLIAILMIAIGGLVKVIIDVDKRATNCAFEMNMMQVRHERRIDSLTNYYKMREVDLNKEIKETLNMVINNYKEQLEEQKEVNDKVNSTINNNKTLLRKTNDKIKNLRDE